MSYIEIKKLFASPEEYIGRTIKVPGWVRTVRDSKTFGFIELNDGTFFKNLQVVLRTESLKTSGMLQSLPLDPP
jgi:Aspartyl/asparaginyl-tRNA synthetases